MTNYLNKKRRNKMKQGNNNNISFGRPTNIRGFAPNILPGIKPTDLNPGVCNNCGNHVFLPVFQVGTASPLQTENGQPTMVQFPVGFSCATCGKINPFGEKKEEKKLEDPTHNDLSINASDGVKTEEKLR